jgi:hypothetical protein
LTVPGLMFGHSPGLQRAIRHSDSVMATAIRPLFRHVQSAIASAFRHCSWIIVIIHQVASSKNVARLYSARLHDHLTPRK